MKAVGRALMLLLAVLVVALDSISYVLSVLIDGVLIGLLLAVALWWPEKPKEE